MLVLDKNYLKYDFDLQEYYININTITKYTSYSSNDLANARLTDKDLKIISHSVYRMIYDYRVGRGKYVHKKYMRKKIYDNNMEEVQVLMFAMIEAVKGAIESGKDLNAYIDEPKDTFPPTVKQELMNAELLDVTEKIDRDLDFSYTAEELSYAT